MGFYTPVFLDLHSYRITFLLQPEVFTEALDDVLYLLFAFPPCTIKSQTHYQTHTVKLISINQMEVDKVEYAIHTHHKHTHIHTHNLPSNNDYALLPNIKLTFISYTMMKALNVFHLNTEKVHSQ